MSVVGTNDKPHGIALATIQVEVIDGVLSSGLFRLGLIKSQ